jgi:hypothetical protein
MNVPVGGVSAYAMHNAQVQTGSPVGECRRGCKNLALPLSALLRSRSLHDGLLSGVGSSIPCIIVGRNMTIVQISLKSISLDVTTYKLFGMLGSPGFGLCAFSFPPVEQAWFGHRWPDG